MEDNTCSKCESVLDTEGYPRWCLKCRAKYRNEYNATKKEMSETRGYAAGCSAMRDFIVNYFMQFGRHQISGFEAAQMARKAGIPQ